MTEEGRILIADDEETFLLSTLDLLRREGYECDGVMEAKAAIENLSSKRYDLLVSDIRMPGNLDLELIRAVPEIAEDLPVIMVTGYPSAKTAIDSLHLRVAAYLVKPLDFDEFLKYVRAAVKSSRLNRDFLKVRQGLEDWNRSLRSLEEMARLSLRNGSALPVKEFLTLNYKNITASLSDLISLTRASREARETQEICHLLRCPRLETMKDAILDAIDVLEKTKGAFRSKDLGDLRKRLEEKVRNI